MFAGSQEAEIIAVHRKLSSECETFCNDLLEYFEQPDAKGQYVERAKGHIRESLEKCMRREKKRFKLTLIMLGVFLIFSYGEFIALLKMGSLKKRSRRRVGYFYMALAISLLVGGIIKKRMNTQLRAPR